MLEEKRDIEDILREIAQENLEIQKIHRKAVEERRELQEFQRKTEEGQRKLQESQQKTEETLRKLEKSLDKARGDFTRKWGAFLENLVEGDLVSLLRNWGLEQISANILPVSNIKIPKTNGSGTYELDLIVKNGDFIIVVEVKTTLTFSKVDKFLKKLEMLKDDLPAYRNKTMYACMAYIKTDNGDEEEDRVLAYAQSCGLFLIRAPGGTSNIAVITNSKGFTPKCF